VVVGIEGRLIDRLTGVNALNYASVQHGLDSQIRFTMSATAFDPELLRRYDVPGPRYTSYPTAQQFVAFTPAQHLRAVARSNAASPEAPLSIYVHVPFCASPCFYCGCTRVITRDAATAARYLEVLLREIELQAPLFGLKRPVEQLHFGGGTPTHFSDEQLQRVIEAIERGFGFVAPEQREFSIEIDPRTVDAARLARLVEMGFTRISLGVQDFDLQVQEAVNRVQPAEMTEALVKAARELGLSSVSMDLIYGLPRQTPETFAGTLDRVVACAPDRVAIYGYAHLPTVFKAQRQIQGADLPSAATRMRLLQLAVERLTAAGYVHIGMDHFAKPTDELALALAQGRLQRNFQGYSTRAGLDLLGLGVSSISRLGGAYSQNARGLDEYQAAITAGSLATARGLWMTEEDRLRATVIERILCGGELSFATLHAQFGVDALEHFGSALTRLAAAEQDGLIERLPDGLRVTPRGRFLLRALAMPFDQYLDPSVTRSAERPMSAVV
jgi:oxygen-independent coproporphyrinogen-3 oxidase